MFKKIFASAIFLFMCANLAQADVKKVAVVDIQKVVTKSAQVQAQPRLPFLNILQW